MRSRSTLNISQELLDKARELAGTKTETETIELALKELIHQRHIEDLKALAGTMKIKRIPRGR